MKKNTGISVAVAAILLFIIYRMSNMKLLGYGKPKANGNNNMNKSFHTTASYPKTTVETVSGKKRKENTNHKVTSAILSDNLEDVYYKEVNTPTDNPLMNGGAETMSLLNNNIDDSDNFSVNPMSDMNLPINVCENGLNNNSPYINILTGSTMTPTAILQFLSNMRNGFSNENGCEFLRKRQFIHDSQLAAGSSNPIGNPNHRDQEHAKLDFLTATIKNCC